MPEMLFHVRWPDGVTEQCYSPSLVIKDHLAVGASYGVAEFMQRSREALTTASDRVREKYGFACSRAIGQLARLEAAAERFHAAPDGVVTVTSFQEQQKESAMTSSSISNQILPAHASVVVIGGGQAGLAMSYQLKQSGIDHVILEKNQIAHSWKTQRWDAFCLVTPNWQCQLPGYPYQGGDPKGFMLRDEIVGYVEDYARHIAAPIKEGVAVTRLKQGAGGGFALETSAGDISADAVVLAVSGYHVPNVPRMSDRLDAAVKQLHSSAYRNPESLPPGGVLVIGSGQSGCQIAEDLHLAGRKVHLAVGSAPRCPRVYRGREAVEWLDDLGQYDLPVDQHRLKEKVRKNANHYLTGRDGGRDIDLRKFALEGMSLYGRLKDIRGGRLEFADDLAGNLDNADRVYNGICGLIDEHIARHAIEAPVSGHYEPVWQPQEPVTTIDPAAAGISTIIWTTGFRSDWSWVELPIFDGAGYPTHERGVTSMDGAYVLGLPWLYTWGSGRFVGVGRDAEFVGKQITARLSVAPPVQSAHAA